MSKSVNSSSTYPDKKRYDGGDQGKYQAQGGYQPRDSSYASHGGDPERQAFLNFSFDDQSIRKGFIRKVYLILMGQLLVTFGFVTIFVFHKPTQDLAKSNSWIVRVALVMVLVTIIGMAFCEGARRQTPTNFICLGVFTLAESFLLGVISSRYDSEVVMITIGITAAVCLSLSIFAMQTKYDFTMCGGVLLVAMVIFLIFGIVAIFIPDKVMTMVYSSFGALLFSVFLIYDTQMMMEENHEYSISPEEYIFAALSLYLDITYIFIYILVTVSKRNN